MGRGSGTTRVKRSTIMVARKHAVLAMMLLWLASSVQQSAARRSAQSASLSVAMRRGGACSGCSTPAGSSTEVSSTGRNTGACSPSPASASRLRPSVRSEPNWCRTLSCSLPLFPPGVSCSCRGRLLDAAIPALVSMRSCFTRSRVASISGSGTGVGPQAGVGSPGGIAAPASSHATRAISDAAASSTAASLAETCPLDAKSELAIDASESRTLRAAVAACRCFIPTSCSAAVTDSSRHCAWVGSFPLSLERHPSAPMPGRVAAPKLST
mmetsp:Transcript_23585/g.60559  ORF Transcript_23585/g.60559 Transcript_23585/m.60559 type:complete len:269 (-) Transcript_23585:2380-3186(-)